METERVLLIVGHDLQNSNYKRVEHLAFFLARRFAKVDAISVTKMYDGSVTDPVWKKALLGIRDLMFKRVKVIRIGNVTNYVVRFPQRLTTLNILTRDFWTYASLRNYLDQHYDVCILADPRLAYVATRMKKLKRVNVLFYEDWDYFPGEFSDIPFWRQIMNYREHICIRVADGVISVGTYLEALRKRQGAKHTTVVSNGADYALFRTAQQKKTHPPTLIFMGTLGEEWGADLPIQALPLIREIIPEVRYLILGSGPAERKLRTMTTELRLDDCVCFLGKQAYQDLPGFLAEADIGVATSRDNDFRRFASPLKIFEYMAAGLPVIGTNFGETRLIIEKARAGLTVEFSPKAFATAVLDLLCDREMYELCSASAIDFASQHDWKRLFDHELGFIKGLV